MRMLIFSILMVAVITKNVAQKRLIDSLSTLNRQMDSMKTLLADARREAKKCSDLLNNFRESAEQQSVSSDLTINNLKIEYQELKNRNTLIGDSLQSYIKTANLLQKIIADEALVESQAQNRANLFAQKLKDSLVDIPENQCYIYSKDKNIYVILSDTLLFVSNFYLSNQGKSILDQLMKYFVSEAVSHVNIKTYASSMARKNEIWNQAINRVAVITAFFEGRNLPFEKYNAQPCAKNPEFSHYRQPPLILEIILK